MDKINRILINNIPSGECGSWDIEKEVAAIYELASGIDGISVSSIKDGHQMILAVKDSDGNTICCAKMDEGYDLRVLSYVMYGMKEGQQITLEVPVGLGK